jgi:hypothetical protein
MMYELFCFQATIRCVDGDGLAGRLQLMIGLFPVSSPSFRYATDVSICITSALDARIAMCTLVVPISSLV